MCTTRQQCSSSASVSSLAVCSCTPPPNASSSFGTSRSNEMLPPHLPQQTLQKKATKDGLTRRSQINMDGLVSGGQAALPFLWSRGWRGTACDWRTTAMVIRTQWNVHRCYNKAKRSKDTSSISTRDVALMSARASCLLTAQWKPKHSKTRI